MISKCLGASTIVPIKVSNRRSRIAAPQLSTNLRTNRLVDITLRIRIGRRRRRRRRRRT